LTTSVLTHRPPHSPGAPLSSTRFVGSTVTRLRLTAPYAPPDLTGSLREGLEAHAFTDYLTPTQKGQRTGFARADKPLVLPADFHDATQWRVDPYAVFAFRIDDKKVPPKKLKAALDEQVEQWCRANLRERCPRAVKEELKEQVELGLLPRCLPTSKVVGLVWNLSSDWILLSTRSAPQIEALRKALHRAFGISTTVEDPDDALDADTLEKLGQTDPLVLASTR